ncbi:MAG TPA: efflux RND transporter periplasmic adaptor subunit [Allosphingosinicella sp.]|jgi:multidrug efflux system membrane fusion protein
MNVINSEWPDIAPQTLTEGSRRGRPWALGVVALVILLVAVGLHSWRAARTAVPPPPPLPALPVAAAILSPVDVPAAIETVGSLRAVSEVMIAPEVAGRIVGIRFQAGGRVQAGALLVQIYDAPEQADLSAAQARASFAAAQLARSEQLAPTGAEPRQLLQQRRAERDQALAAVRQLAARVTQKQIRAPFSGEIGIRRADVGQYLNPGDPIATLTNLDSLYVDFSLPQQELAKVRVGGTVRISSDAWPGRTFAARVNAIEPRVGEDTRSIRIQAVVPNRGRALRPGMSVSAALDLPPERNALVVPATAIQLSASGESITVIRGPGAAAGGKAEVVAVSTGRRVGDQVIVTQGLNAGDVVVTEGQTRIRPGADVKVAIAPAKAR